MQNLVSGYVLQNLESWISTHLVVKIHVDGEFAGYITSEEIVNLLKKEISMKNGSFYVDSKTLNLIVLQWKNKNLISNWRNELHQVNNFTIERSVLNLFGFKHYGCHLTAYVGSVDAVWVAKRSPEKQTWPGMLDSTVGGAMMPGQTPMETIIRESWEEASIVDLNIKAAGCISYTMYYDGPSSVSGLSPEVQYVFDLQVSKEFIPKPMDGEVSSFELISTQNCLELLVAKKFKPNSALVLIDFFIRHGVISSEEQEYQKLVCSLHQFN